MHLDLTSEKILLVEDSPTQAMILQEALEAHQLQVQVAKNGQEALDLMPTYRPTLIVSDIEMPVMNGYEFCQAVKKDPFFKHVPLILLTNMRDPLDAIRGIECGADNFITKPCDIHFLMTTMSDLLQNCQREGSQTEGKREFYFHGQKHLLQIDQTQVTDLLLSTFASAIQKNLELEKAYRHLNALHEEMAQKNIKLEQLNQEKNKFLGMAAHDLKNPLTVITRYGQMLIERARAAKDEELVKMLERIYRSSSFMLQLINDLLSVTSIEAGTLNFHPSKVNFIGLVQEAIQLVSMQAEAKKMRILFDTEIYDLEFICDRDKMLQVFINLLTNAIKFSQPGKLVTVSLYVNAEEIFVDVIDQGEGMSQDKVNSLFQPFDKSHSVGTGGEVGTGLGLAIVKKIILAHSGKVWVDSLFGHGTTFHVCLPRKA